MTLKRACRNCKFLLAGAGGGECRRNPPHASERGAPIWPFVQQEDWCGEFAPKPDLAARTTSSRNVPEAT